MTNYQTIVTPSDALKCTPREAKRLQSILADDDGEYHGFSFHVEGGEGYLQAEEAGSWDMLPAEALTLYAALIRKAGLPYVEFGAAFTCDKLRAGSHGGTAFRIMADGTVVDRTESWESNLAAKDDGLWLSLKAASGKQALINLSILIAPAIVSSVIAEVWRTMRGGVNAVQGERNDGQGSNDGAAADGTGGGPGDR